MGHILVFLYEKMFEGCGGLLIDDEIRVTIAAQACILLLHREPAYYPTLRTILVYPSSYLAKHPHDEKKKHHRLGESVAVRAGRARLGLEPAPAAKNAFGRATNVVMHEFAHQLDQMDGAGRRRAHAWPRGGAGPARATVPLVGHWYSAAILSALQKKGGQGQKDRDRPTMGATNPAEFFATATEAFFEKPRQLKKKRPELYEELRSYYKQDPVAWHGNRDC